MNTNQNSLASSRRSNSMKKTHTIIFVLFLVLSFEMIVGIIKIDGTLKNAFEDYTHTAKEQQEEIEKVLAKNQKIESKFGAIPEASPDEVRSVKSAAMYFPMKDNSENGFGKFYLHVDPGGDYLVEEVHLFAPGSR